MKELEGYVRLNISACSDIMWWCLFAEQWRSMLYTFQGANPQVHIVHDPSDSRVCGAYLDELWFQFQWPAGVPECHISVKGLIPIAMASKWKGLSVRFHCDNSAVVALLNVGAVRDNSEMYLMRCLSFVSAKFNFVFSSCHIGGIDNSLTDALSQDNYSYILAHRPRCHQPLCPCSAGVTIPPEA